MKIKLISILGLVLLSGSAMAASKKNGKEIVWEDKFRIFTEVGVQNGGDNTKPLPLYDRFTQSYAAPGINLVSFGEWVNIADDLDPIFEDSLKAGGLFDFAFGAEFSFSEHWSMAMSFGYLWDEISGDTSDGGTGELKISRNKVELIPFWNYGRHRVGIGGVYHFNTRINHKEYGDGFDMKTSYKFDESVGGMLQYDYLVNEHTSIGFRYVVMDYTLDVVSTRDVLNGVNVVNTGEQACTDPSCDDLLNADSFGMHLIYHF